MAGKIKLKPGANKAAVRETISKIANLRGLKEAARNNPDVIAQFEKLDRVISENLELEGAGPGEVLTRRELAAQLSDSQEVRNLFSEGQNSITRMTANYLGQTVGMARQFNIAPEKGVPSPRVVGAAKEQDAPAAPAPAPQPQPQVAAVPVPVPPPPAPPQPQAAVAAEVKNAPAAVLPPAPAPSAPPLSQNEPPALVVEQKGPAPVPPGSPGAPGGAAEGAASPAESKGVIATSEKALGLDQADIETQLQRLQQSYCAEYKAYKDELDKSQKSEIASRGQASAIGSRPMPEEKPKPTEAEVKKAAVLLEKGLEESLNYDKPQFIKNAEKAIKDAKSKLELLEAQRKEAKEPDKKIYTQQIADAKQALQQAEKNYDDLCVKGEAVLRKEILKKAAQLDKDNKLSQEYREALARFHANAILLGARPSELREKNPKNAAIAYTTLEKEKADFIKKLKPADKLKAKGRENPLMHGEKLERNQVWLSLDSKGNVQAFAKEDNQADVAEACRAVLKYGSGDRLALSNVENKDTEYTAVGVALKSSKYVQVVLEPRSGLIDFAHSKSLRAILETRDKLQSTKISPDKVSNAELFLALCEDKDDRGYEKNLLKALLSPPGEGLDEVRKLREELVKMSQSEDPNVSDKDRKAAKGALEKLDHHLQGHWRISMRNLVSKEEFESLTKPDARNVGKSAQDVAEADKQRKNEPEQVKLKMSIPSAPPAPEAKVAHAAGGGT